MIKENEVLQCSNSEDYPNSINGIDGFGGRQWSTWILLSTLVMSLVRSASTVLHKDVNENESRNAWVLTKILVLENLISRRPRNSRTHKANLCCPN